MAAQTPMLAFEALNLEDGSQVTFKVFPASRVYSGPTEQLSSVSDDGKYILFFDPDTITPVPRFRSFTFVVSIRQAGQNDASWYAYDVRAEPVGKFADVLANVKFKIKTGTQESAGLLKVPVHSTAYDGDLQRKMDDSAVIDAKVSRSPAISLRNSLDNLGIHVTGVEVHRNCERCWEDIQSGPLNVRIGSSASVDIPLNIRPKPLWAMLSTALILKKDKPQDTLAVKVWYNVEQGGISKDKTFNIPVRFAPSIWHLVMATIIGGIVGAFLKRILDHEDSRISWGFVGKIVFLSIVAEFFAAVAASFDSKLIILSFDMDPRQIIPAAILAFTVTGGPTATKWVGSIIQQGRTGDNQNSTAAIAGGDK